jgi:hypothetical protein
LAKQTISFSQSFWYILQVSSVTDTNWCQFYIFEYRIVIAMLSICWPLGSTPIRPVLLWADHSFISRSSCSVESCFAAAALDLPGAVCAAAAWVQAWCLHVDRCSVRSRVMSTSMVSACWQVRRTSCRACRGTAGQSAFGTGRGYRLYCPLSICLLFLLTLATHASVSC